MYKRGNTSTVRDPLHAIVERLAQPLLNTHKNNDPLQFQPRIRITFTTGAASPMRAMR